jgi:hypothetical protein
MEYFHSFDLDYGTVMMDSCCTSDVILQRIHFVRSSSFAVNKETDIFEACQILQPKDQATVPILELAPCQEYQLEPLELWHGSRLKFQRCLTPTADCKFGQTLEPLTLDCMPWVENA